MRLLDTNTSNNDPLVLKYGQVFTMKSIHGRMLTMNTHEYSAKTFLNAFAQISAEGHTPSVVAANANNQVSSLAASSVQDFLQTLYENSSPSHYGRFVMQPCTSKVKKDTPVCYGHIVHIYYVRDQDQKMESCGKYLIMNGNFPQLGFVNDSDHQNSEPITVSAIKTLPLEELSNFPVRIGEDIGLKRIVCNQLDQFYLSARKTSNVVQRNKSTNLASWEKFTICQKDGKSVTSEERNRLLNELYTQTKYQRDRTVIVSFRNQFKKAVPKENLPTESELQTVIEKQIGFPVEEVSYLDNLNDWSNEEVEEEEIEEIPISTLGEAQKEFETPKVLQSDSKDKKIFTKYAKIVLNKKIDRDILGHFFYYELTKSLYLKFMIPKDFTPSSRK